MATDPNKSASRQVRFQAIISHCKEYGFIFPSSEIYDGLSAVYDYGQWGGGWKKKVKVFGWGNMPNFTENIVAFEELFSMTPTTRKPRVKLIILTTPRS